ncbi:MAG TPA: hypothetical protein VJY15_15805, partial [Candidatus Acidoferrum sp.]|nr:hypothetical protein [Candidatus Acidoferrum sp.]
EVVNGAEAVLRSILKISLEPSIELRRLAKDALSKSMEPDPLQSFSQICRADLDNIFGTPGKVAPSVMHRALLI